MKSKHRRYMACRRGFLVSLAAWLAAVTAWTVDIREAEAVPAFARKYDMTCNVCHTRQPRLNAFGQRFLENGYQLPGTEDGGTTMKRLLGGELNGATLDDVANFFAVRLRADIQKASFKEKTEATDDWDIVFPNIINLFFAGTATKNISFFFEAEYATQEAHEPALAFERAMLMFDNLGGHQVANVKIGVFDPSAFFSFPTHRQQLNPIAPDAHTDEYPPEINRVPLLPLAFASKMFGLTTGKSNAGTDGFAILPFQPYLYNAPYQTGISVHGRPFGPSFLYQVGLAQNKTAEDDSKTRWDSYVMLRYDLLRGEYSAFQVSGFYYRAPKAAMPTLNMSGTLMYAADAVDWTRYGIGARWQHKFLDVYGTVIWDEIDRPRFSGMAANSRWDTDAMGVSLEADWLINQNWLLGVRYDYMDAGGLVKGMPTWDKELNQDASFIGIIGKYYPTPNIGLYARAHFNLKGSQQLPSALGGDEHPARNLENMFTVGVDMAF